jgi:hypothetical protein
MRRFILGFVSSVVATVLGCSGHDRPMPGSADPKFQEISALPVGLKVTHSPNPVKAQKGGPSGQQYTWVFETVVETLGEPVTITEFGALAWFQGRWALANFTGAPFTAEDFADWYSCPGARIGPGQNFNDPINWSGDEVLRSGKTLWYFVGVTADGKKVKGEAVVEQLGAVEQ